MPAQNIQTEQRSFFSKLFNWTTSGMKISLFPLKYTSLGIISSLSIVFFPIIFLFRIIGDKVFNVYSKNQPGGQGVGTQGPAMDINAQVNLDIGIASADIPGVGTVAPGAAQVLAQAGQAVGEVAGQAISGTASEATGKPAVHKVHIGHGGAPPKEVKKSWLQDKYDNSFIVKKRTENEEKARNQLLVDIEKEIRNEKPVTYRYTITNEKGKKEVNTFIAYSKMEVFSHLENEGHRVIDIQTSKTIEFFYGPKSFFAAKKFKTKDLIFWITQLSTYIKSGIPLTNAMRILSKQMSKDKGKRRVFDAIIYNLTLGESFSSSLEKQDNVFPALLINMIKAAEATGELEATLDDMAEYYTDVEETRKQMVSAMSYPIVIMVFALGVVTFVLVYVIPQFAGVYAEAGAALNPFTQFILDLSHFLQNYILVIIIIIIVIIAVFIAVYRKIKAFRYSVQRMTMKMPIFGNIIIYKEMNIFAKTFSSLLKHNVFITDSIGILTKITSNEIYREIMIKTVDNIAAGDKISDSFKDHWAIPDVAYYMIVTGESTGELADMMGRVGDYYQSNHKAVINTMKSFIEPALIVFLAVVVGGIVMAIILPMFGLYDEIG